MMREPEKLCNKHLETINTMHRLYKQTDELLRMERETVAYLNQRLAAAYQREANKDNTISILKWQVSALGAREDDKCK